MDQAFEFGKAVLHTVADCFHRLVVALNERIRRITRIGQAFFYSHL